MLLLIAGVFCLAVFTFLAGMAIGAFISDRAFHDSLQRLEHEIALVTAHLDRVLTADDIRTVLAQ